MISNPYSIKRVSEMLDVSTTSVAEIKGRLGMIRHNGIDKYILNQQDYIRIEKIVIKIKKQYGYVTLSTIYKFFN